MAGEAHVHALDNLYSRLLDFPVLPQQPIPARQKLLLLILIEAQYVLQPENSIGLPTIMGMCIIRHCNLLGLKDKHACV